MAATENRSPNLRETRKEMAAAARADKVTPLKVAEQAGRPAKSTGPAKASGPPTKEPSKTPAKKAAKKTAPKKEGRGYPGSEPGTYYVRNSYQPVKGKKLYEATGESGQISVYSSSKVMTHAVSLAEPDRQGAEHLRQGRICSMHESEDAAKKMVERLMKDRDKDDHTRAVVVNAREYSGPVMNAKPVEDSRPMEETTEVG